MKTRRAKRPSRGALTWLVCVALALAIHTAAAHFLGENDVILAVMRKNPLPIAVTAALAITRAWLYFFAPAWGLYIATRAALETFSKKPRDPS